MSAKITRHAQERGGLRMGLSLKSVERMAEIALERGLTLEDTSGTLHQYLTRLQLNHPSAKTPRIYGEHVFLFAGEVLVTVMHLPKHFKGPVAKIRERRRKEGKA